MEYKDYYKILGVEKNADEKEIKKTYRRLARRFHPDLNPGDKAAEARFKEINEANEVLSDAEKRRKYDELGQSYQRWQQTGGGPSGFDWNQWSDRGGPGGTRTTYGDINDILSQGGFSDFFDTIFGSMGMASPRGAGTGARSQDLEHEIEITLDEAFHGAQRILEMDGRRLEVKLPAGVKTGSRVRVAGEAPSSGAKTGPRGDLYLRIKVLPHPGFERRDADLHCEVAVDLFAALLGGEVYVPTLAGSVALRIPAGTQAGRTFRLSGQGMPKLRSAQEHGDLYARVRVMLPEKLNEREQSLVREWAALRGASA
jgi:curved DNA-binding protein